MRAFIHIVRFAFFFIPTFFYASRSLFQSCVYVSEHLSAMIAVIAQVHEITVANNAKFSVLILFYEFIITKIYDYSSFVSCKMFTVVNCLFLLKIILAQQKLRKQKEKSIKRTTTSTSTPRRHSKKSTRPVIELATTEPDFDCLTTDFDGDADENDESLRLNSTYLRMTRIQRRIATGEEKKMPPELTVKTAQRIQMISRAVPSTTTVNDESDKKIATTTTTTLVSELPSIGRSRKNFSWQNFKRCAR